MTDHRPELRSLTAFRFFAALAVFLRHVYPWLFEKSQAPNFIGRCMYDGFCGVTFFFVLSGFILTYNYRSSFASLKSASLKDFYAARLARIGPVHLLAFFVALPLIYREILANPLHYVGPALANLTFTQSFIPYESYFFSFNSVSWSLSDEIFFYALLPLVLWGMHRIGFGKVALVGMAAGLWALAMVCVLAGENHPLAFWCFCINPAFRLFDFLIGVALGQLFLQWQDRGYVGPSPRWATLLEVGSLALVFAALAGSEHVPYLLRRSVYYTPSFALVIVVFAFGRGRLSRLCSGRTLRLLGEASFSFYMFHYLIIRAVDRYPHATHLGDLPPLARAVWVFALSQSVSVCCYLWYEVPARRMVKQWLLGKREASRSNTPEALFTPGLGTGLRLPG